MVTDFEQFGFLEQLQEAGYFNDTENFTPITVTEVTAELSPEDLIPSITESMSDTHDASLFADLTEHKQYTQYEFESQEVQVISPTDSSHSELLDLENGYLYPTTTTELPSPVSQESYDSDPDWTPTSEIISHAAKTTPHRQPTVKSAAKTSQPTTSSVFKTKTDSTSKASSKRGAKRKNSTCTEIELQIEIEESTKRAKRIQVPLTEEQKRLRRKELNRLAAQRCRSKRKSHADVLEEEIDELTKKNRELRAKLEDLESTKTELYDIIKFHFASCHSKSQ